MRYEVDIPAIAPRAVIELRGDPDAAIRCLAAADLRAPSRPNSVVGHEDGVDVLWLGPRRWLAMAPLAHEETLARRLEDAATTEPMLAAVRVSDMWAGLALRGSGTREVLAQGTPLDLDAAQFATDAATFTDLFAGTALLRRAGDGFEIWIDRSLAQHLAESLRIAAGLPATAGEKNRSSVDLSTAAS